VVRAQIGSVMPKRTGQTVGFRSAYAIQKLTIKPANGATGGDVITC
jgi:hypothetical protein